MKHTVEIDAVDIPTMYKMSIEEYKNYIETEVFWVDHHDVLRSAIAQYPLAVTREQLHTLIAYLQSLDSQVGADRA
jgi:predicted nucleic-acid-binding protein